jgi:helicase
MIEIGNWLSYSLLEVAKLLDREDLLEELQSFRMRIKYGIKEELLPLVVLEGIGRARARALYNAGLTDLGKVAKTPESKLSAIPKIGLSMARKLKEQIRNTHSIA